MSAKVIATALFVLGSLVTMAWVVEAVAVGRGFISTYLAPLAFVPLIASAMLWVWIGRSEAADTRPRGYPAERGAAPDRPRD